MKKPHSDTSRFDSNGAILSAQDITIGYKKGLKIPKIVHQHLSFGLHAGELTCLIGPNGAGKSTLLRSLAASQPLLDGNIFLTGVPIHQFNERKLSQFIGLVLTERNYAGALRVHELVALGRYPYTGFFGRLSEDDLKVVDWAMKETGIIEKKNQYVAELSDGERQKAMIAKALTQESSIIILDEPTSFLDIISRIEIMTLLRKLAVEHHKAILLSTHDLEQALISADKLWLLSNQDGLCCGTPEDLALNGAMNRLFKHHEIIFDQRTGNFKRNQHAFKPVEVVADARYLFWISNLLNRFGYYALPSRTASAEGTAINSKGASFCLQIKAPNEIILVTNVNESHHFNSFESLCNQLKSLSIQNE